MMFKKTLLVGIDKYLSITCHCYILAIVDHPVPMDFLDGRGIVGGSVEESRYLAAHTNMKREV